MSGSHPFRIIPRLGFWRISRDFAVRRSMMSTGAMLAAVLGLLRGILTVAGVLFAGEGW